VNKEDNKSDYTNETVYTCNHCGKFTYKEINDIEKHIDNCIKNVCNKSCLTCNNFKVRLEPSNYNNKYYDNRTIYELGYNNKGMCSKYDTELEELDLLELNKECWIEYIDNEIDSYKSDNYIKFEELINQIDIEDKSNQEWIQEFHRKMAEVQTAEEFQLWCDEELKKLETKVN
jgi:predicted transport protein